ncbi:MAG: NADH-quinone oxidoreductase subunit NuoH [Motiliproteus sp.]|nr:NADH-quinone oxidoreductase subunit NuoH [Motiliproteus sp.]
MFDVIVTLINIVFTILILMVLAAVLVWAERRILGIWQDRLGPNRVGPGGILQAAADMIKIFFKEDWIPPFAEKFVFVFAPCVVVITMLGAFAIVPFSPGTGVVDLNVGVLFFLAMSALAGYSTILAGWSSNNKYALLGGMRSAAQMISYDVFMGLSLMGVVMLAGSFNLREIVESQSDMWNIFPQFIGFCIFMVAGVAESHRLPFDLPEAEHEIIAGFHTEYSGMKFGLFFVGEYLGVLLISALAVVLFLGGWMGPLLPPFIWFCLKTLVVVLFIILLRAAIPRPRFDQLMAFGWKICLPVALLNLVITGAVGLAIG